METIPDLRKALKPVGFKVLTESVSWGRTVTYGHIESGDRLTYNVFTSEQRLRWKPLFDWTVKHREELANLKDCYEALYNETITGLFAK